MSDCDMCCGTGEVEVDGASVGCPRCIELERDDLRRKLLATEQAVRVMIEDFSFDHLQYDKMWPEVEARRDEILRDQEQDDG